MAFIHTQPANFIFRSVLRPFRKIIPEKYYFAIDGKIEVELTEGKVLHYTANPTSNLLRVLFWYGIEGFEFNEFHIFTTLIKKSGVFFDIGANIGYYSIVAKLYNKNIDVYGFEPLPGARKYFDINVRLNNVDSIVINEVALCDKDGKAIFHSNINPRFRHLKEHLFGDNSLDINSTGNFDRVEFEVKTERLDTYVKENLENGKKIDLIKMDTEGTENLVLKGAVDVLSAHRPIIMCEIIRGVIERDVQKIMSENGYLFYRVTSSGLKKSDKLFIDADKENYFFVPQEKENFVTELVSK